MSKSDAYLRSGTMSTCIGGRVLHPARFRFSERTMLGVSERSTCCPSSRTAARVPFPAKLAVSERERGVHCCL